MMKRWLCVLLCLCLIPWAFGCGGAGGKTIRLDLPGPVDNLDPQFATDSAARMIIGNLYEGLMARRPDGSLAPGAAESYTVSPDGLRYTFTLREGLRWDSETPLTAGDFVFAFQRIFSASTPSPYAEYFLCIENGAEVLGGDAPLSALGVSSSDDRTVVFRLAYESPFFLEQLAAPAAAPCQEAFFRGARGRYGLERDFVRGNGPYTLKAWDNSRSIQLKANPDYASVQVAAANQVYLYVGRGDAAELFLDGKSDMAYMAQEGLSRLDTRKAEARPAQKTVWCLVFNQNHPVWGNPLLRLGLAYAVDRAALRETLPQQLSETPVFVPPALDLAGTSYRTLTGRDAPVGYDPQRADSLFRMGLQALDLSGIPQTALLVPGDAAPSAWMQAVRDGWTSRLSAYVEIQGLTAGQIEEAYRSGDFQILLMPFSPADAQMKVLMGAFSSDSSQNHTGYRNPRYDSALQDAFRAADTPQAAAAYRQAEMMLLSDAVVIPLYYETTYCAFAEGLGGIDFSPYLSEIRFVL